MTELADEEKTSENVADQKVSDKDPITSTIGEELLAFVEQISSLSLTLRIALLAVIDTVEKRSIQATELIDYTAPHLDPNSDLTIMQRAAVIQKLQDENKQLRIYGLALETIPRSYLMTLISHYDAFLGELIKFILLAKPELLTVSEKNLSLAQLIDFGSIENAKNFILEKEIEGVLRKSHAEQFSWMESKFNIPLRQGLDIWSDFIEITERRNLYVHTGGIVSSQYLKVCRENGVPLANVTIGDELSVDSQYFQAACNVIFELAFKLAHVLWRKFLPDQLSQADSNLMEIGYEDALVKGNYHLTKKYLILQHKL